MNTKYFEVRFGVSDSAWDRIEYVDNSSRENSTERSVVTQARFVMLFITNCGADNFARIPEFQVWGTSGTLTNNASVQLQGGSVTASIEAGESKTVTIRVKNTGTTKRSSIAAYRLGSYATNQFVWSGFQFGGFYNSTTDARAYMSATTYVSPAGTLDFTFTITAPPGISGSLSLSVQIVMEGIEWFGEIRTWNINVSQTVNPTQPPVPPSGEYVKPSCTDFIYKGSPFKSMGANLRRYRIPRHSRDPGTATGAQEHECACRRVYVMKNGKSLEQSKQALRDLISVSRSSSANIKFIVCFVDFYSVSGYHLPADDQYYTNGLLTDAKSWYGSAFRTNYKPFMGEFGFGDAGGDRAYGGGYWDDVYIPETSGSRYGAIKASVDRFFDIKGADCVLQWGFMVGTDNGEGDSDFGLDTRFHSDWNDVAGYYSAKAATLPGQLIYRKKIQRRLG